MLPLVSVTLLGASVSAEKKSNVVTPEGSELSDPSVGHEFKATYAANFVHDLQQLMLDGYSSTRVHTQSYPILPKGTQTAYRCDLTYICT